MKHEEKIKMLMEIAEEIVSLLKKAENPETKLYYKTQHWAFQKERKEALLEAKVNTKVLLAYLED